MPFFHDVALSRYLVMLGCVFICLCLVVCFSDTLVVFLARLEREERELLGQAENIFPGLSLLVFS